MTTYTHRSWGTFELDDATGMPVLPEGQFWRVKGPRPSSYVIVQRMETRRFRPRPVGNWHPVTKEDATPSEVRGAAAYILWKERNDPDTDYRKVLGDYPPKKLGEL